jgi:hypothetical protein
MVIAEQEVGGDDPGGGDLDADENTKKKQTSKECRAAALQKLADGIKARSDYYPSDAKELYNVISKGVSGAGIGGGVAGPAGAIGGFAGGAFVAATQNGYNTAKVEAPAVAQFRSDDKECQKIAKAEARERGNNNAMSAALPQMFVVTKMYGVFALYGYSITKPTLIDLVTEDYGPDPGPPVNIRYHH